jgi:uncharacterized protein with GYD domain
MAKYMARASYTAEGTKGLLKDGGSARVASVTKAVKKLGGKVETFYFAYGAADAIVIVDMPDETSALALSLAVNASGAVTLEMVPLISPKQMDEAAKLTVGYRAPGE